MRVMVFVLVVAALACGGSTSPVPKVEDGCYAVAVTTSANTEHTGILCFVAGQGSVVDGTTGDVTEMSITSIVRDNEPLPPGTPHHRDPK